MRCGIAIVEAVCGRLTCRRPVGRKTHHRYFAETLSALLVLIESTFVSAQEANKEYHADTSIRVDVRLVDLNVTVTDKTGRPYARLKPENFRIYDNGMEQMIHHFSSEDRPYAMGLVLDRSGSMAEMIRDVYRAAFHTVRASKAEDEFFVMTFNEGNSLRQDFSRDRGALEQALKDADVFGATALYDAMWAALERITQGSHDKKAALRAPFGDRSAIGHRPAAG